MRKTATMLAAMVATAILIQVDIQPVQADHFASRRRDAELRRQQALQAPVRRPWGGPTTAWRPPVHRSCPPGCTCARHRRFPLHGGVVWGPGGYSWYGGSTVYFPRYQYYPAPQYIHIERIIRN